MQAPYLFSVYTVGTATYGLELNISAAGLVFQNVTCDGSESSIQDCSQSILSSENCNGAAGVICTEGRFMMLLSPARSILLFHLQHALREKSD